VGNLLFLIFQDKLAYVHGVYRRLFTNSAITLVILHTSQHQAIIVEDQLKKLAKPGAVVVHHSLSITKCLQNRIHLHER